MKLILFPNVNAPHNLRQIIPSVQTVERFATEVEACEYVVSRQLAIGEMLPDTPYWIVDEFDLPGGSLNSVESSDFFDVWEWSGDAAVVNMPKARGIHMNRIRLVRNAELVKKDVEFMRALEADNGSHTAIAAEKQVLRNIPQTFDLTTEHDTPEELKQKWPEGLPKE